MTAICIWTSAEQTTGGRSFFKRFRGFELTRVSTYLNISNEFRSERSCLAFSLPRSEAKTRKWASRTASLARDTVQERDTRHTVGHGPCMSSHHTALPSGPPISLETPAPARDHLATLWKQSRPVSLQQPPPLLLLELNHHLRNRDQQSLRLHRRLFPRLQQPSRTALTRAGAGQTARPLPTDWQSVVVKEPGRNREGWTSQAPPCRSKAVTSEDGRSKKMGQRTWD